MLKRWEHLLLVWLGVLISCLIVANMTMVFINRSTQADIQGRTQFIHQSAQLEVLYREIVKALADLSVKNQDAELRGLLAAHGITVTVNPGTLPQAPSVAAEPARKGSEE